jgi:fructan beta-fructosidase
MRLLVTILAVAWSAARLAAGDPDIVIADFEGNDYAGWTTGGTAFGDRPARGTLPNQMPVTGFRGRGLANSFVGGDAATGTLTSPPFVVRRDYINFLIGGGKHPGETCLNLLVDGRVVRTATGPNGRPGGSEKLGPATWDVRELKGQAVVVQAVDRHTGSWGHLTVDHITQSNTRAAAEVKDGVRAITMTGRYLLFPVSNSAKPVRMTVAVGGRVVHDFEVNLAADRADWWAHLDLSGHRGATATLTVKDIPADLKGFDRIEPADAPRDIGPAYGEALRPQLRFSQARGWNNDPNGLVYYDGEYHLFWQSNPFGLNWGNMYWGHAVSRDLVHWQELALALHPRTMAKGLCFSGSVNITGADTVQWLTGGAPALVAAFTDTEAGEALAVSTDRGRTWRYPAENPVIRKREGRDPKLIWYEPARHWVIAVYTRIAKVDYVEFYSSTDLRAWTPTGRVEGYFECPELFGLPVDGDASNKRWVLSAANGQYAVGRFDGNTFTPGHPGKHRVHYGIVYAPQCFSRMPGGRVVQVGWARVDMPGMPFNQAFTLPLELRLASTPAGVRLKAEPIRELEALRGTATVSKSLDLMPGKPLVVKAPGDLLDIVVQVDIGWAKQLRLRFGTNEVVYDVVGQTLDDMPLSLVGGRLQARIVVDRPMYEVVGGDGVVYETARRSDGGRPIGEIKLSAVGGLGGAASVTVYPMRPIWTK